MQTRKNNSNKGKTATYPITGTKQYYQNGKKEKAKKVNIIDFLRETYPELVFERKDGSFAYSKNPAMTFFAGRDGYYHYCDNAAKKKGAQYYSGDNIKFLMDYIGGYTFLTAVDALAEFADIA